MIWCLRKAEAYLEVRRAFSQAPGRERLAQIAGEGRPTQVQTDYSPTTLYNDYPISPILFHWQTQSNTREDSPTGRRYREHAQRGSHILLFVRRRKQDDRRVTAPYTFLGPATYVTHKGERPMSITWRLHHPMPAELFEEMKVAAG